MVTNGIFEKPVLEIPKLSLTADEAALSLGVCKKTLVAHAKEMGIPFFSIGNRRLFPVHLLREWMSEQAKQEGGDAE